jgi:antitoxin ParD1/3/4
MNNFIKQAQNQEEYYDFVKLKIERGEKSGFEKKQPREEMLAEFKLGLPK